MSTEENKEAPANADGSANRPVEQGKLSTHAGGISPEADKEAKMKRRRGDMEPPAVPGTEQEQVSENNASEPADEGDGNRFDFGGLPNRNLKKNLGCG